MAAEAEAKACELRLHPDEDSFFAACSEMLFAQLAMHQIILGSVTNKTYKVLGSSGRLPDLHAWDGDSLPQVKQLFSFHCPKRLARGALALSPGRPEKREFVVLCAGELEESLVAEALSMADPDLVRHIGSCVGPAAACEAIAGALQQHRPGIGREQGMIVVAMEQDAGAIQDTSLLPSGHMRRMLPPTLDGPAPATGLCEATLLADETMLETLADWHVGFVRDALNDEQDRDESRGIMERLVATCKLYVWDVEGTGIVACCSVGRDLADVGCSLNLVYTPPEHRKRGFAQALVTEMGAALVKSGRRICLFADGKGRHGAIRMYEKLGYVNQGMHHQILFPAEGAGTCGGA